MSAITFNVSPDPESDSSSPSRTRHKSPPLQATNDSTTPTGTRANTDASGSIPKAGGMGKGKEKEKARSTFWHSDIVDGVSVERKLVEYLVTSNNWDRMKIKAASEKNRTWDRLAEKWHGEGYTLRTAKQVQSKVDELMKKYRNACGFADHTGQGVKSDQGQEEYERQLSKIFKYYDLVDSTLGTHSGFRSKRPFGNLAEMEKGYEEVLGLKGTKAAKRKAEEIEAGDDDEDLDDETAKAKARHQVRSNAVTTSTGPISFNDALAHHTGSETEDIDVEDTSDRSNRTRGKGKGGAIADSMRQLLGEAAKDRKAQMLMIRDIQKEKEERRKDGTKVKKLKEFRALEPIMGKELAWEQIFQEPYPAPRMAPSSTNNGPSSTPSAIAAVNTSASFVIDPSLPLQVTEPTAYEGMGEDYLQGYM